MSKLYKLYPQNTQNLAFHCHCSRLPSFLLIWLQDSLEQSQFPSLRSLGLTAVTKDHKIDWFKRETRAKIITLPILSRESICGGCCFSRVWLCETQCTAAFSLVWTSLSCGPFVTAVKPVPSTLDCNKTELGVGPRLAFWWWWLMKNRGHQWGNPCLGKWTLSAKVCWEIFHQAHIFSEQ